MAKKPSGSTSASKASKKSSKQESPSISAAQEQAQLAIGVDPGASRMLWADNMRVTLRPDAQVAILTLYTAYPEVPVLSESARIYTSVKHLRSMLDVIQTQLAKYDELAPGGVRQSDAKP